MNIEFQNIESPFRCHIGLSAELEECRLHLTSGVKDNLLDSEEWQSTLESLRTLRDETGFKKLKHNNSG